MTATTLEGLEHLLDQRWLSDMVGFPAAASKIRIKPETSILASLTNTSNGQIEHWVRLLWPQSHNKAQITEQWAAKRGHVVATTTIPGDLVFQFGSIYADPKLNKYLEPEFLGFQLPGWSNILRYNPSRRIVAKNNGKIIRVTVKPSSHGKVIDDFLESVIPTPRRFDDGSNPHTSIVQRVGDADLSQISSLTATETAGRILGELHKSTNKVPDTLRPILHERTINFHQSMEAHANIFACLDSEISQRIRRLAREIPELPRHDVVLSHGDASPDQYLISLHDGHVWLTDFDRICFDDPSRDLGSYLSVIEPSEKDAFLEGYATVLGSLPPSETLAISQIQAQMLRVAEPLRSGDLHWRRKTVNVLSSLEEVM